MTCVQVWILRRSFIIVATESYMQCVSLTLNSKLIQIWRRSWNKQPYSVSWRSLFLFPLLTFYFFNSWDIYQGEGVFNSWDIYREKEAHNHLFPLGSMDFVVQQKKKLKGRRTDFWPWWRPTWVELCHLPHLRSGHLNYLQFSMFYTFCSLRCARIPLHSCHEYTCKHEEKEQKEIKGVSKSNSSQSLSSAFLQLNRWHKCLIRPCLPLFWRTALLYPAPFPPQAASLGVPLWPFPLHMSGRDISADHGSIHQW